MYVVEFYTIVLYILPLPIPSRVTLCFTFTTNACKLQK